MGYHYPKTLRLLNASEFSYVFDRVNNSKASISEFTLLARANGLTHPRLGLTVPKKQVRKACNRNRIKRAMKESFRLQQHDIYPADYVVLIRKATQKMTNQQINDTLSSLFAKIKQRLSHDS